MFEVIINPAGAGGATKKIWLKAEPIFKASGIPYHITYSTLEYDINDICNDLTKSDQEVNLVIVGGDGSMNKALNGIYDFSKVCLGFIPCGSGNDLAKALGISMNPVECAKQIVQQQIIRILDFGEVTYFNALNFRNGRENTESVFTRRFNISSGIGFDAEICENADRSKAKKFLNKIHLGKLIYILVAIRIIFACRKFTGSMALDNHEPIHKQFLAIVAMNTAYEGGGFKFCPAAKGDDGILDVCAWGDIGAKEFFMLFPSAYSGKHLKHREVNAHQTNILDIQTDEPCWVHTDGEVECQSTHVQMKLANEKLRYLN